METGRYKLYGFKPASYEDNNVDAPVNHQKMTESVVVYQTDDRNEAKNIVQEGGFISKNQGYIAVQGAVDSMTGGTIGTITGVKL